MRAVEERGTTVPIARRCTAIVQVGYSTCSYLLTAIYQSHRTGEFEEITAGFNVRASPWRDHHPRPAVHVLEPSPKQVEPRRRQPRAEDLFGVLPVAAEHRAVSQFACGYHWRCRLRALKLTLINGCHIKSIMWHQSPRRSLLFPFIIIFSALRSCLLSSVPT